MSQVRRPSAAGGTRKVTIADVARQAGVSPATVSRVLNGLDTVDPVLAERVRQASQRLHYRPSAMAQGLARGATRTVGVVVPDLANPFFSGVLKGLTKAAAREGFSILVADADEDPGNELRLVDDLSRRADGLVLCSPRMADVDLRRIAARGVPLVCTNRLVRRLTASSVVIDSGRGMVAAVEHLAALGHARVAYLAGPDTSWSNRERLRALREYGGAVRWCVVPAGSKSRDGHRATPAALAAGVTAIIAFNDLVALGVLARLRELGIAVPEQVSVVGFDDIIAADFTYPALTTVSLPKEELGRRSWELLRHQINGGETTGPVRLTPTLVVRGSTAVAAAPTGRAVADLSG